MRKSSSGRPRASSSRTKSFRLSKSTVAKEPSPIIWFPNSANSASSAPISKGMAARECPTSPTVWSLRNSSAAIPACAASSPCSPRWSCIRSTPTAATHKKTSGCLYSRKEKRLAVSDSPSPSLVQIPVGCSRAPSRRATSTSSTAKKCGLPAAPSPMSR